MLEKASEAQANVESQFSHSACIFKKEKVGKFEGEEYIFEEKEIPYLHIDVGGDSYDENILGLTPEDIQVLRKYLETLVRVSGKESLATITPALKTKVKELLLIPKKEDELVDPTEDLGTGAEDEDFPASPTNPQWPPR